MNSFTKDCSYIEILKYGDRDITRGSLVSCCTKYNKAKDKPLLLNNPQHKSNIIFILVEKLIKNI